MSAPVEPLLSASDFTGMFDGTLNDEQIASVTLLLKVASSYIVGLNASVDATAAKWVLFELGRDEVLYGNFKRLVQFNTTTSRHTESGTFDPAQKAIGDLLSDAQKQFLGIGVAPDPQGTFGDGCTIGYIDNGIPAPYYYTPGWYYTFPPGY